MSDQTVRTQAQRWRDAVTGDLIAAHACRAAASTAVVSCVLLAAAHQWLASGLVLWLVPSLLVVGGQARRAHRAHVEMERSMEAWREDVEGDR